MKEKSSSMLIDHLETARKLLKDLYIYGCYTSEEYSKRLDIAKRTYDKEIARLDAYISGNDHGTQKKGKLVYHHLLYDRYTNDENYLYAVYKMKRYKLSHLLLYVCGLQIIANNKEFTTADFKQKLGCTLADFDKKAIDDFLDEMELNGVLRRQRLGTKYLYLREENMLDLFSDGGSLDIEKIPKHGNAMVDSDKKGELTLLYYAAELFAGKSFMHAAAAYHLKETISSYLYQGNWPYENSVFIIQKHFLQEILNEELIWRLEEAIHKKKCVRVFSYKKKGKIPRPMTFEPGWMMIEHMYGRQYVFGRNVDANQWIYLRLDWIQTVEIINRDIVFDDANNNTKECMMGFDSKRTSPERLQAQKSWCVALGRGVDKDFLVEVDFSYEDAPYIRRTLEMEKQWGEIEDLDDSHCVYRIRVNDVMEMKPWLRRFGRYAKVRESSEHQLREQLEKEWRKLGEKYGIIRKEYEF